LLRRSAPVRPGYPRSMMGWVRRFDKRALPRHTRLKDNSTGRRSFGRSVGEPLLAVVDPTGSAPRTPPLWSAHPPAILRHPHRHPRSPGPDRALWGDVQ
jgi:hypothetical protein